MTLYLECEPDQALATSLGVPKRNVVHCAGKGRVCHFLATQEAVIGMVDEDPHSAQPSYLQGLVTEESGDDLKVLCDRKKQNRMIVICPKFEDWIIETAHRAGLKMSTFNLSENSRDLHAEINQRIRNLENLVADLTERKSPRLLHLKALLCFEKRKSA